jgi:hypothetical protein
MRRGVEAVDGARHFPLIAPKGRNEEGPKFSLECSGAINIENGNVSLLRA